MRTRMIVLMALVLAGVLAVPVRAQGGLSEKELALLDRVYVARDNLHNSSSYVEVSVGEQAQTLTVEAGGRTQSSASVRSWDRTATVLREGGALWNVQAFLTMTFENSGPVNTSTFSVNGEARLVGGVLYVNGAFEDASTVPAGITLPEGWVALENDGRWPVLERLGLDAYLDESSPFDDIEVIKAAATSITSEPDTLEDGTPVDLITIAFDSPGVVAVYRSMKDLEPTTLHILDRLGGDTQATLVLALDASDTVHFVYNEVIFDASGLDPAQVGVGDPNATVRFEMNQSQTQTYSDFDAPVAPVAAPDTLAE